MEGVRLVGVTYRSIIIGLILIPITCFWIALSELVWYSGEPTTISLFYNVIFFLVILAVGNLALQRYWPSKALNGAELLVVYTMLAIASAFCSHDMLQILIPSMTHLGRYALLENRYSMAVEHVPSWLVVEHSVRNLPALDGFYLGQESIYSWDVLRPWVGPLLWWCLFTLALGAVLWGLNLVFRKQWTENEKLAYPIIQLPMELSNNVRGLLRNRLFWLAFGLAGVIDLMNGLHVLFPMFPEIPIVHVLNLQTLFTERPWSSMGPAWVSFYPFAIGLCFFMPLDLAFSCWFFFIFWKAQRIVADHIGIHGMPGFPFVEEQTAGGYYAIALIALWITRQHLARAGKMLVGKAEPENAWERKEMWTAVALIAGGGAFLVYLCLRAGMDAGIVVVFFVMYFMLSVAITRMRAELGHPSHDLHAVGPHRQITRFIGPSNMFQNYKPDLAMFGLLNWFNRAYRGHPMPHGMEGFRIAERMRVSSRRMFAAQILAVVAGTVCAFWALLWAYYKYGAAAMMLGPAEWFGRETWDAVEIWVTAPEPHTYGPATAIAIGLVFCLGLSSLRMALTWWPFHPVGYATSGSWAMEQLWVCIFLAWLVKLLLLRYGGAKAYRPAVPFFMGLILGDFMVGSFWNLYGIVMETQVYHFWPY
jgi:hypothetical protein